MSASWLGREGKIVFSQTVNTGSMRMRLSVVSTYFLLSIWSQVEALEPTGKASGEVLYKTVLLLNFVTVVFSPRSDEA